MATTPTKTEAKTSMDYLQEAISDVDKARQSAGGEMRERLDEAMERLRTVATELRERAEEQAHDLEASLDRAGEELRIEFGVRAVRAQRSPKALTRMSSEIRKRRAELAAHE